MDVGAVLGAVGILHTTVVGTLGLWWLRILNKRHQNEMEKAEVDRKYRIADDAIKRKTKKETQEEFQELFEATKSELSESREQIHDLLNRVSTAEAKETVCQIRLARAETLLAEMAKRIEDLEMYIEDLEAAMSKANLPIVRRRRPNQGSGLHKPVSPILDDPAQPKPTGDDHG
jgi:chromosome segregation ATPase